MGHLDPSAFGPLLRQRRADAGLTQEELAERARLSARVISDLERGVSQRPHFHTVRQLAEALDLTGQERQGFEAAARGTAQLKGMSRPLRLVQMVPADAADTARPRFLRPDSPPSNLPPQATLFVGRVQEVAEVTDLLRQEDVRLLTLTGAGGSGKTRLALQAAESLLAHFAGGAVFVSLAATVDPALVISAIASALGVKETAGRPLLETLAWSIGDRQLLLVLDNFEHLLEAAPAVAELIARAPRLKVLVTSRAVLHLSAEHEYPVPPLALPDTQHALNLSVLSRCDAVALFLARARAVNPHFALTEDNAPTIAEICARLDGLPLAIELAAARLRLFPPKALLARLSHRLSLLTGGPRDLPARQQTLRDTIEWSYALLNPAEQQLFARLSVFAGGCTLEAAEAVCQFEGDLEIDVVEGLGSLVEQSLVGVQHHEEPRFMMLETVREYAGEKLAGREEAEKARHTHAQHFLALAEQIWNPIVRPWSRESDYGYRLPQLEAELPNFREALSYSEKERQVELGLRLAGALSRFWDAHGDIAEGRRWLDAFLADRTGVAPARHLLALDGAARLAGRQGDVEKAAVWQEEYRSLAQQLGDERAIAKGSETLEEAVARWRAIGDLTMEGICLGDLGLKYWFQGDYQRAAELYEASLDIASRLGDEWSVAINRNRLGYAALLQGNTEQAVLQMMESLRVLRHFPYRTFVASILEGLAGCAGAQGQPERAAQLFGAAEGIRRTAGLAQTTSAAVYEQMIATARGQTNETTWDRAWQEGAAMALEQAIEFALSDCPDANE